MQPSPVEMIGYNQYNVMTRVIMSLIRQKMLYSSVKEQQKASLDFSSFQC